MFRPRAIRLAVFGAAFLFTLLCLEASARFDHAARIDEGWVGLHVVFSFYSVLAATYYCVNRKMCKHLSGVKLCSGAIVALLGQALVVVAVHGLLEFSSETHSFQQLVNRIATALVSFISQWSNPQEASFRLSVTDIFVVALLPFLFILFSNISECCPRRGVRNAGC
jgi:hypothetical protein